MQLFSTLSLTNMFPIHTPVHAHRQQMKFSSAFIFYTVVLDVECTTTFVPRDLVHHQTYDP